MVSKGKSKQAEKAKGKVTEGAKAKDWSKIQEDAKGVAAAQAAGDGTAAEVGSEGEQAPIPEVKKAAEPAPSVAEMARMKEQLVEYKDIVLRSKAEVENMRLRTQKEVERAHAFALERFVKSLLPVADSLEQAIAGQADEQVDNQTASKPSSESTDGLKITYELFIKTLADFGVQKVGAPGEPFDANVHEAMSLQDVEGAASNTVVTVVRTGYSLNGRAVRPAMVIVAK